MIGETKHFLFLSNLLGLKVYKNQGHSYFGKIVDIVAISKEIYPEVSKVVISRGWFKSKVIVPWENFLPFELPSKKLYINQEVVVTPVNLNGNDVMLKDTFLDKQVLDVSGCKVVRINDFHLLKENSRLWVVHMDVGFRGILRRLGWERMVDTIMEWMFSSKLPDKFVSWKYVQQLPPGTEQVGTLPLKLKSACQPLTSLHPADLAEIILDLNRYERVAFFRSLDLKTASEVLSELKLDVQRKLIDGLERDKRHEVIGQMLPDKAADLLSHMPPSRREEIMKRLPPDNANTIKGLLAHPEETAGSLMTTRFVVLNMELTVEQTLVKLKELAATVQALYYIYVVDINQSLLGVVTLRRLMAASPTAKLGEIMNTKIIKVKTNTSEKKITNLFIKYNFGAIPVVDNNNKILGIIIFKDAVDKVLSAVAEKGH